jgi:hypothetical protein
MDTRRGPPPRSFPNDAPQAPAFDSSLGRPQLELDALPRQRPRDEDDAPRSLDDRVTAATDPANIAFEEGLARHQY